MSLGAKLAMSRKRLGYTLGDLAVKLGVSAPTLSRIENGEFSYYCSDYENLLAMLRQERLREEVREFPELANSYIGEMLREQRADEDRPGPQLAAV
ncbi:MAG: helix-turn-helix domain-containing protein [Pseudonocardiaceae bacterium]